MLALLRAPALPGFPLAPCSPGKLGGRIATRRLRAGSRPAGHTASHTLPLRCAPRAPTIGRRPTAASAEELSYPDSRCFCLTDALRSIECGLRSPFGRGRTITMKRSDLIAGHGAVICSMALVASNARAAISCGEADSGSCGGLNYLTITNTQGTGISGIGTTVGVKGTG